MNKNIYYIHFDSIDSTNTWVKKNALTLDPNRLTCVTALEQTAGRGRFLRKWLSPKGQNIYTTLYFTAPLGWSYLSNVGQILSIAAAEELKNLGFDPQIKWPNDLLIEGKKIAGILGETVTFDEYLGVVLGIGINVDTPDVLLNEIGQPAASLSQISGHLWQQQQILEPIVENFLEKLETLKQHGFAPFQQSYESFLAFKGTEIRCHDGLQYLRGICHSIDNQGRLNLLLSNNDTRLIQPLHSGEIL